MTKPGMMIAALLAGSAAQADIIGVAGALVKDSR